MSQPANSSAARRFCHCNRRLAHATPVTNAKPLRRSHKNAGCTCTIGVSLSQRWSWHVNRRRARPTPVVRIQPAHNKAYAVRRLTRINRCFRLSSTPVTTQKRRYVIVTPVVHYQPAIFKRRRLGRLRVNNRRFRKRRRRLYCYNQQESLVRSLWNNNRGIFKMSSFVTCDLMLPCCSHCECACHSSRFCKTRFMF